MTEDPCTASHKTAGTKPATKPAQLASYWLAPAAEETNYSFDTLSKEWLNVRHLLQVGGFLRSWKTWKSHGILKWSFPGLEKSWNKLKS